MAGGAVGTLGGPLGDVCSRLHERLAAVEAEAEQLRTAIRILARYGSDAARVAVSPAERTARRPTPVTAPVMIDRLTQDQAESIRRAADGPRVAPRVTLTRGKTGTAANAAIRARAFAHYRSLGPGRRLKQVATDLGINLTTLQSWAKREAWSKRVGLPEEGTGPVPVEETSTIRGGHVSRNAATPAFTLPLDEVAVELCTALEERGPLTDREFIGHCRDANLFAGATDQAIALAFSNVVHDEPKMFRRRRGIVELVK